ncbi:MAG: hypothetical protein ACRC2T_05265, partial [Thermoguttaceae bacterium]
MNVFIKKRISLVFVLCFLALSFAVQMAKVAAAVPTSVGSSAQKRTIVGEAKEEKSEPNGSIFFVEQATSVTEEETIELIAPGPKSNSDSVRVNNKHTATFGKPGENSLSSSSSTSSPGSPRVLNSTNAKTLNLAEKRNDDSKVFIDLNNQSLNSRSEVRPLPNTNAVSSEKPTQIVDLYDPTSQSAVIIFEVDDSKAESKTQKDKSSEKNDATLLYEAKPQIAANKADESVGNSKDSDSLDNWKSKSYDVKLPALLKTDTANHAKASREKTDLSKSESLLIQSSDELISQNGHELLAQRGILRSNKDSGSGRSYQNSETRPFSPPKDADSVSIISDDEKTVAELEVEDGKESSETNSVAQKPETDQAAAEQTAEKDKNASDSDPTNSGQAQKNEKVKIDPQSVGDPNSAMLTQKLLEEIEARINERGIAGKYNMFRNYARSCLDKYASKNTGNEVDGRSRLSWYDKLYREPLTSIIHIENFSRELHAALKDDHRHFAEGLRLMREKLDVKPRNGNIQFSQAKTPQEAVAEIRNCLVSAQAAYSRALSTLTAAEQKDLATNLYPTFAGNVVNGHTIPNSGVGKRLLALTDKMDRTGIHDAAEALVPITDEK